MKSPKYDFNVSENGKFLELFMRRGRGGTVQYRVSSVNRAVYEPTTSYEELPCNIEDDRISICHHHISYPIWLKVQLMVKEPIKGKKSGKSKVYYLHIVRDESGTIKVETHVNFNVGDVDEKTWSESIWRLNETATLDRYTDLLRFYLLNTPSKDANVPSKQGIDVYKKWGKDCFKTGKNTLKEKLSCYNVDGISDVAKNTKEMKRLLVQLDLLEIESSTVNEERLYSKIRVGMVDTEKNQYLSMFKHIRNSIAHGSFLIRTINKVDYFLVQDSHLRNVTARGVLTMDILRSWKSIILSK